MAQLRGHVEAFLFNGREVNTNFHLGTGRLQRCQPGTGFPYAAPAKKVDMMVVFIGGRTLIGTIVVLLFFLLSLTFVIWFERDNRRRDSEQSDMRPPVFAAMDILQPAVLSFILICIALMIMMWLKHP